MKPKFALIGRTASDEILNIKKEFHIKTHELKLKQIPENNSKSSTDFVSVIKNDSSSIPKIKKVVNEDINDKGGNIIKEYKLNLIRMNPPPVSVCELNCDKFEIKETPRIQTPLNFKFANELIEMKQIDFMDIPDEKSVPLNLPYISNMSPKTKNSDVD